MSDFISREAAIKAHCELCPDKATCNCDICPDVEVFFLLPSVQSEPQWIPCEERLPEVGRTVLFSVGGMRTEEGCLRSDGEWEQFHRGYIQSNAVVSAWMPLPEPYGGEQE